MTTFLLRTFFLALAACLALQAQEPDMDCRNAQREKTYQDLVAAFGVPKAFWRPEVIANAPENLRKTLSVAASGDDTCRVLGILDLIDDLDRMTPEEKFLEAQAAWTARFFKEGERASRKTALGPLFKALDQERTSKLKKGAPSSSDMLRAEDYALVRQITWRPFRKVVLQPDVNRILGNQSFVLTGDLPRGFSSDWLVGAIGRPEVWDRVWESTWTSFPDPARICAVLERMPVYRPQGLSGEQRTSLWIRIASDWDLPYRWAASGKPLLEEPFPAGFWLKVRAAANRDDRRVALSTLMAVASNPRDRYEVMVLLEALGTESDLKLLLEHPDWATTDPKITGWTSDAALKTLTGLRVKYEGLVAARVKAERRAAEGKRSAEAARLRESANRKAEVVLQRVDASINRSLPRALSALADAARGFFLGDSARIQSASSQLATIGREFQPSSIERLKSRIRTEWKAGSGASIADNGDISNADRAKVNQLIQSLVAGIRPGPGSGNEGGD